MSCFRSVLPGLASCTLFFFNVREKMRDPLESIRNFTCQTQNESTLLGPNCSKRSITWSLARQEQYWSRGETQTINLLIYLLCSEKDGTDERLHFYLLIKIRSLPFIALASSAAMDTRRNAAFNKLSYSSAHLTSDRVGLFPLPDYEARGKAGVGKMELRQPSHGFKAVACIRGIRMLHLITGKS